MAVSLQNVLHVSLICLGLIYCTGQTSTHTTKYWQRPCKLKTHPYVTFVFLPCCFKHHSGNLIMGDLMDDDADDVVVLLRSLSPGHRHMLPWDQA